ncbi:uncharacterized protein EDB91DRAFT_1243124 [Suillus paluster]|uniref:uncharacterized protein n=1 Tax=Suillus paluster TaxID=48578 RepID=UPI001B873B2F|nr:uncharacterized protein EDB91DRAFT_1243124 [Suillus paluster]KAG1752346.1 hypothetical protein EDB91DRAFT_1243124 [Suillus paluster]
MSSPLKSNKALAVADMSLHHAIYWIRLCEADGSMSAALQQHGRNALVILPLLLSAAAKVRLTMNQGIAPQWARVWDNDPHMESHLFFPKTVGYGGTPTPAPQVTPSTAPAPMPSSKAFLSDTEDEDRQPGGNIVVATLASPLKSKPAADNKIVVNDPQAITSADDFSTYHWVEPNSNDFVILTPTPVAGDVSLPSASLPLTISTIHKCVVSLAPQVTAMQVTNQNTLARVDAVEQDCETWISSMRAELSFMHLDLGATVTLMNGLVGLVEKLQQTHTVANSLFPPLIISNFGATSATTQVQVMGIRYLNGVYSPLVGTSASAAGPSASHPDMHSNTFTSGQVSLVSAHADPSSAPAVVGPHSAGTSPASATQSLP